MINQPAKPSDKPLHDMTPEQLKSELNYRTAICRACDRDDLVIHKHLQSRVNEVERAIRCVENGEPVEKDN